MAICMKDFVFIFITLLRSMGIQCRLVVNLAMLPIRPPAKDLFVISSKNTDKGKSGDDGEKAKKSSRKKKASSVDKHKENDSPAKGVKDTKSKPKLGKLKSKAHSIGGKVSSISMKSTESSNAKIIKGKETVKSSGNHSADESNDINKKMLKRRSVSIENNSSINTKRSRGDTKSTTKPNFNDIKNTDKNPSNQKALKRRSLSLQSSSQVNQITKTNPNNNNSSKLSKLTSTNINVVGSPISKRTRRQSVSRAGVTPNATITSKSIPQLDGGDDIKKKKGKPQLIKKKFPIRSRSVSPTSASKVASKSSQSVKPKSTDKSTKKAKPNLFKIRLPSRSRSLSKSRTSTSEHISKKSRSNDPSVSPIKSSSKSNIKNDSRSTEVANNKNSKFKSKSRSRAASNSPTSTSEHISRKSKKQSRSNDPSVSPVKSSSKSNYQNDLRSTEVATVTATDKHNKNSKSKPKSSSRAASKSPEYILRKTKTQSRSNDPSVSPVKSSTISNTKNDLKNAEVASGDNNKNYKKGKPNLSQLKTKSTASSTSTSTLKEPNSPLKSPIKSTTASNRDRKLPRKAMDSKSPLTSKASMSPTKVASSTKSNSKPASTSKGISMKTGQKHNKALENVSSDSDFAPTPKKKLNTSVTIKKPLPKAVENLKKCIDRRVLSTDDEGIEPAVKKNDMNYWLEVYCESERKWICIDLFKLKVNSADDIKKKATKPISYVFAWNNNNTIRDVSPRYCSQWNTTTRKLRVPSDWLNETLSRYKEPISQRCLAEDRELEEIHSKTPIPTSISELKNHPLYVLTRHLLKFEGIYPPNPAPLGYIRDEPIYSRLCVHTLHSREIWVKQARVVKPGEIPYKIVKARPKWDRLANKMLEPQPLEIFGYWQTQPYEPPTAENGVVPRNAYGNVELFKPEMLPKKTVHLRLPGLNRVCAKLKIDCAQAVVGFDFHGGSSHPTFDGFVVCEEFSELVTMRWWEEQEEAERKAQEKQSQRVYDNWKKLIKGLLIRERLQRKYNFANKDAAASSPKKN